MSAAGTPPEPPVRDTSLSGYGALRRIAPSASTAAVALLLALLPAASFAQAPTRDPDLNNDGIVNALDVSRASGCYPRDVRLSQPSVTIASPLDGARQATFSVDVSGTVANAATLSVNGAATTFAGGAYATTVGGLALGPNVIEAVVTIADAPVCWDADFNDNGQIEQSDVLVVTRALGRTGFPKTPLTPPTRSAVARVT